MYYYIYIDDWNGSEQILFETNGVPYYDNFLKQYRFKGKIVKVLHGNSDIMRGTGTVIQPCVDNCILAYEPNNLLKGIL